MKTLTKSTVVAVALLSTNAALSEEALPKVEAQVGGGVRFEHVEMENQDGRYVLSGKIKRRSYNSQVAPGHVDYVVYDGKGSVLTEGAIAYSPSLSLRRWKYGSSFSVLLPETVDKEASVKIAFHKNQGAEAGFSRPVPHDANILMAQD